MVRAKLKVAKKAATLGPVKSISFAQALTITQGNPTLNGPNASNPRSTGLGSSPPQLLDGPVASFPAGPVAPQPNSQPNSPTAQQVRSQRRQHLRILGGKPQSGKMWDHLVGFLYELSLGILCLRTPTNLEGMPVDSQYTSQPSWIGASQNSALLTRTRLLSSTPSTKPPGVHSEAT